MADASATRTRTAQRLNTEMLLHRRSVNFLKKTGFRSLSSVIDALEHEPERLGNNREEAELLLADLLAFLDGM